MKPKYIVLEYGYIATETSLDVYKAPRIAMLDRCWENRRLFDGKSEMRMTVDSPPTYSKLQAFLAHVCWNPTDSLDVKWEKVGDYDPQVLIDAVSEALKTDDDIIQQWFDGKEVIGLMKGASSFHEMLMAVSAICGEHEVDDDVRSYVERTLPESQI